MPDSNFAVGIPTCERAHTLTSCLASLFAQDVRPEYLIVVDQTSRAAPTQEVSLMLRAWGFTDTQVIYSPMKPCGTWAARKRIIKMAQVVGADTLVLLDDDLLLCSDAILPLLAHLPLPGYMFAMGTYVAADLRQGWARPSEFGRIGFGSEYHWYVSDKEPFGVGPGMFASTFVVMPVPLLVDMVDVLDGVPIIQSIQGDPAFIGSDDRAMAAYLEAKGLRGVIVPNAKAVHLPPDAGSAGAKEDRRAWLDRRLRQEILRELGGDFA